MKKIIITEEQLRIIIEQELSKLKDELLKRLMSKVDTENGKQVLND